MLQEFEDPKISRQPANEGGKVVGPSHRPILPNRRCLSFSFLLDDESRLQGRGAAGRIKSMKNKTDFTWFYSQSSMYANSIRTTNHFINKYVGKT